MGLAVWRDRNLHKGRLVNARMSAESNNLEASLFDQLASFDNKLDSNFDDVQMLAEVQEGIGRLLASNGSNEAEVRRVLQDRYENGGLRKETFQLVKSMLDHYVIEGVPNRLDVKIAPHPVENMAAIPSISDDPTPSKLPEGDDPFGSTTIIPLDAAVRAHTAEDLVQVGSVLRDRFLLQERISGGSMGVVYKALDRRLAEANAVDPYVAVKILSPQLAANGQALRALQQEAAKGRCLTHPNIVRFIDLDRDDELYFIVMEWLEGRTLADILDAPDSRQIDQLRAFQIVYDIGKALDYAHRCGIVHADVTPGNIMIMPNGDAKLFDFGVARVRQKQLAGDPNFDPAILGRLTPAYSSMQVLTGDDPVPSDDVFSLACLLYRLIAGYRVFGPRNAAEAAEEGMKPQRLAGISDGQWRTLKKALSFSRVTRFETMAEFIEALGEKTDDTVSIDVIEHVEFEESEGPGKWIFAFIAFATLFGVAGYQFGYLDEIVSRIAANDEPIVTADPTITADPAMTNPEPIQTGESSAVKSDAATVNEAEPEIEEPVFDAAVVVDEIEVKQGPPVEIAAEPLMDFSQLPLPTAEIHLLPGGVAADKITVTIREDGAPAIIDAIREDVSSSLTLRLEEVGFSGNRSPWVSGQYALENGDFFEFPVGQERARVTLTMASDPLREADQQSTLLVREVDSASSEIATITVVLEDDDQRKFEAQLPANTVAFSMSQASVRERDPAVQIDIQRFNPDNTSLVVDYSLRDVTATEGEDYFAPSTQSISFGPGQRSARLLIPLVRDSEVEGDEAFIVDLSTDDSTADGDVYHRIVVMIRDSE